ncbi:hypothetical protein BFDFBN_BFDFBN_18075, partial [Dysosmobacter welbionis]
LGSLLSGFTCPIQKNCIHITSASTRCHLTTIPLSVLAEIRLFDLLIGQQLRAGAGHGDVPRLQHIGQVRDLQGHVGVLLDQQYRHALAVDLPDDGEDVLHHQRRQA